MTNLNEVVMHVSCDIVVNSICSLHHACNLRGINHDITERLLLEL